VTLHRGGIIRRPAQPLLLDGCVWPLASGAHIEIHVSEFPSETELVERIRKALRSPR
jgi:hypothetical protein